MSTKNQGRRNVARHGQLGSPGPLSQILKLLGIALTVVLISGLSVVGYVVYDLSSTVQARAVEIEGHENLPPDIGAYEGGFNMLLVGIDECEPGYAHYFGERCTGDDSEGRLNDVNLLIHVSEEPRRLIAVSFPRDLMVPIPECTDEDGSTTSAMYKQQINSAYTYGGLNCAVQTISKLSGQEIQYAAAVSFGGVIEITNAIGGVEVCLASGISDEYTNLDLEAGLHTLAGIEALQFLRTRYGVGDGSDLGRIGNQQQYMSSLARKLISGEVLGDVPVLMRLANVGLSNLTPSASLANPMTLVQIALALKNTSFDDIVFLQYPVFGDPDDPNRLVPDRDTADLMWAAINANERLGLNHDSTDNDGVVVIDPEQTDPADPDAPVVDADGQPIVPAEEGVYQLPPQIRGVSAAQQTCSNGNMRE